MYKIIVPLVFGIVALINVAVWYNEATKLKLIRLAMDLMGTGLMIRIIGGSMTLNTAALFTSLGVSWYVNKQLTFNDIDYYINRIKNGGLRKFAVVCIFTILLIVIVYGIITLL